MRLPTKELILRYFETKGSECLVTTRELLSLGQRAAVDKCTFTLVREQILVRVAWGVFHLATRASAVTVQEVALVKAQSFGRQIMQDSERIAKDLQISPQSPESSPEQHVFEIDGRTSSFRFGEQIIKLRATCKKNFALGETPWGKIGRALLRLGASFVNENTIEQASAGLSEPQRLSLLKSCPFMPAWLSDRVIAWYYLAQKKAQTIVSITITDDSRSDNVYPGQVSEDLSSSYCILRPQMSAKALSRQVMSAASNHW